jgi:hypothetical protein
MERERPVICPFVDRTRPTADEISDHIHNRPRVGTMHCRMQRQKAPVRLFPNRQRPLIHEELHHRKRHRVSAGGAVQGELPPATRGPDRLRVLLDEVLHDVQRPFAARDRVRRGMQRKRPVRQPLPDRVGPRLDVELHNLDRSTALDSQTQIIVIAMASSLLSHRLHLRLHKGFNDAHQKSPSQCLPELCHGRHLAPFVLADSDWRLLLMKWSEPPTKMAGLRGRCQMHALPYLRFQSLAWVHYHITIHQFWNLTEDQICAQRSSSTCATTNSKALVS